MRKFTSGLFLTFCCLGLRAFTPPSDILEAQEICDKMDLRPVEGIWTYPDDDVTVMIIRNDEKKGIYDIYVVESSDCSLNPGMRLGEMRSSADPDKYHISLFTNVKKGILTLPMEGLASFNESKESLTVKKKGGFRIRLNPTRLLPSFWRIASISIKSGETAPEGMIKIYPSYDGNGSTRRAPRYL